MQVREFYRDKTIFLTGTTGFVGKVVLEKFLRSIPHFKKIFVMVRAKKNKSVQERLNNEILSSEVFQILFKDKPEARQMVRDRVVPIAGDLIIDKLGLSPQDRALVTSECDIVINCAASVNFDDPLLDALEINYFGCLRMMQLAKECKNIIGWCHVSTAYVNCNMDGNSLIDEKIYALEGDLDPEEVVRSIIRLGPQRVQEDEEKLIMGYPNTYTFSKSLAERAL
jgi:thioester reductase-like protein